MTLPPRLTDDHVDGLFEAGRKPEDAVMPCERCGAMPAGKVNLVGEVKRLCVECNRRYYASNWEIWAS
jgi:hypothetical protein